jgi:hypothetical protein
MILAFRDTSSKETFLAMTEEDQLNRLFATYVRTMLSHRLTSDQLPRSTLRRVGFLARQLEIDRQSVFSFDLLDEHSLLTIGNLSKIVWPAFSLLAIGTIVAALYGWRGAIVGLYVGLISSFWTVDRIDAGDISYQRRMTSELNTPASDTPASDTPASDTPASDTPASDTPASDTPASDSRNVQWELMDLWITLMWVFRLEDKEGKKENAITGFLVLTIGVVVGVFLGSLHGNRSGPVCAGAAILVGFIAVLNVKIFYYVSEPVPRNLLREFPSPGLRAIIRRGVPTAAGVAVLSGMLASVLVGGRFGLATAGSVFLYILGCCGGYALVQQAETRFILRRYDFLPIPSRRFFDYAVQCLFLQRVGDGYIFVHRSLQEFFSGLWIPGRDEMDPARLDLLVPPNR